jgi:hypothetical protein
MRKGNRTEAAHSSEPARDTRRRSYARLGQRPFVLNAWPPNVFSVDLKDF